MERRLEPFWRGFLEKNSDKIYWAKWPDKIFEWEYPRPFRWFPGGYTNAAYSAVDHKAGRLWDKPALIYTSPELGAEARITYGELYKMVLRHSSALRACGLKKGDAVLIYMTNNVEAVASILAAERLGIVTSTVFAGFAPKAVADRIELVEPRLIFTQDYSVRRGKRIPLKEYIDEAVKISSWKPERVVVKRALEEEREPPMERGRDLYLEEFLELGRHADSSPVFVESSEPLLVMPTSGTTARPKPVVHVHGGYQAWIIYSGIYTYGLRPRDVIFNTSDIGWIVGQSYIVHAPLIMGATSILFDGSPDHQRPDVIWETLERYRATLFWTSPTMARLLMRTGIDHARRHDVSSVERVAVAGEALNPPVWRWLYEEVFEGRAPVIDHMWQTETGGPIVGPRYSEIADMPYGLELSKIKPGSAGRPLPWVEMEIVDERGEPLPPGQKGIVVIKSPFPGLTPTLWKDHERYLKDYWGRFEGKILYYTGDSAYVDEEGYVFFTGRADEVIKIAAHRIGTIEIESTLLAHPAVAEAAVVGVPDPLKGEAIAAFVVLRPGWIPSEDLKRALIEHVRRSFGPIAAFAGVEFVNMLPKTRSGKILRRVLKRLWTGEPLGDLSTIEEEGSVDEIRKAIASMKILRQEAASQGI